MQAQGIKSIKSIGVKPTLDFQIDHPDHNFYANGVVVSNSHSWAYSKLSALSVYCKFNYPSQFFLEALKMSAEKQDPSAEIAEIVQELPVFGIELLPPSLTKSSQHFTLEGKNIRFGLESIKGISSKSIENVQSFIKKDKTNLFDVFQAAVQSKLNATVLNALIEVGTLDDVSPFERQKTAFCAKVWKELTVRERNYCMTKGEEYGYDLIKLLKEFTEWKDSTGKKIGAAGLETIRKKTAPALEIYRQNAKEPLVSQYLFEKKLLGYCPTLTLSELFEKYQDLRKISEIKDDVYPNEYVEAVAELKEIKMGTSKKGNKYARFTFTDETGTIVALFTGKRWEDYLAIHDEPVEEQLIYFCGKKGGGEEGVVFMDSAEVQNLQIFSRVSDLNRYLAKGGEAAPVLEEEK